MLYLQVQHSCKGATMTNIINNVQVTLNTPPSIDYVAYAEQCVARIKWLAEQEYSQQAQFNGGSRIEEFRAFGMQAPRQSGKSTFALDWYKAHPDEVFFIFKSNDIQRAMSADAKLGHVPPHMLIESVRKKIHSSSTITIDVPADPDAARAAATKAVNAFLVAQKVEQDKYPYKYVIVDESTAIFSYYGIKRKEFNNWVANNFPDDVIVIHVG